MLYIRIIMLHTGIQWCMVYSDMATIQKRKSRGHTYWYIVESRRVDGKPRPVTLAYLGKPEDLLLRLAGQKSFELKSYSHGDSSSLINMAHELEIIDIINKHVPAVENGKKPIRDNLTVGASLLLAAIGRACHPTSKLGWYDWCKNTSLEYCLKRSFRKLDSRHFWDQMHCLPAEKIPLIEEDILKKLMSVYKIKLDCLFFDTTNFFTFIDSANIHCDLPQRGNNKQKRFDLRQIGMALLVSRKDQFPLFHRSYRGNKNDVTVFKEILTDLMSRLKQIAEELTDITIVFDKGNNSKGNFKLLGEAEDIHYVGGLVSAHFIKLIMEANKNFRTIIIDGEELPVYRVKKLVWGEERTCVITVSNQLKEGQIRGIHQHLEKKCKELEEFKRQLENPKRRTNFAKSDIEKRLKKIIKGQFIDIILKYQLIDIKGGLLSFTYYIDNDAFDNLKSEVLGRKIMVTNRHEWTNKEIILAYRGQSKVEYAFRNLKNPFHCAVRPQYHWTNQKIEVHILICIIGYLLTVAAYSKSRGGYERNMDNFLNDLRSIRLVSIIEKKEGSRGRLKVNYTLENIPPELRKTTDILNVTNQNLRPNINVGVYNQ